MMFFRKSLKELYIRCDSYRHSQAQYSIMISNIPRKSCEKLQLDLEEHFGKEITSVNLCFDLTEYTKLTNEKTKKIKEKAILKKNIAKYENTNNNIKIPQLEEDLKNINKRIDQLTEDAKDFLDDPLKNPKKFLGIALVSFQFYKDKEEVVKNKKNPNLFKNNSLVIIQAPEPTEINFENLSGDKLMIRIKSWIASFLGNAVFVVVIYFCLTWQYIYYASEIEEIKDADVETSGPTDLDTALLDLELMSMGISFLICVFNNFIIMWFIEYCIKIERHVSYTDEKKHLAWRKTLVHF